ncbi:MAG: hypothetical protein RL375_1129 [Pseudomonadota bacterium]
MSLPSLRTRLSSPAAACAHARTATTPCITPTTSTANARPVSPARPGIDPGSIRGSSSIALAVLAAFSIGLGRSAQAQTRSTGAVSLEPVVITASRSEQALPDTLLSTRVISRDQIEQSQAPDLPALLRGYTSIDMAQAGPPGSQTSLFLRGADSKQVLLVVDGVPMNRADLGTASWQNLALDQIDRVEIVRGNASALWGAQAVGGVVQVFTRRASQVDLTLGIGSRRSAHAAIAAGRRFGEGDRATRVSLALSQRVSGGLQATDPAVGGHPDRDASRQAAASARLEQGWAAGHSSALSLSTTHSRSAYDGDYRFSFPPVDPLSRDDQLATSVDALGLSSRHALTSTWQLAVDLGQTREAYQDPTGPDQFGNARGSNRTRQGQVQLTWQPTTSHTLVGALEDKREATEDSSHPLGIRSTRSLRLGWLGSYAAAWPIDVQTSLRSDDSSAYGRANTGLLALAVTPLPAWKFSAQWSTAFSAPSFSEQQFAVTGTTLKPERARNAELATHYQRGDSSARLAWFRQRQSDRITSDGLVHADFKSLVNIAHAANHGVELLARTRLGTATLGGEAIWQNARDVDTGKPLKRRARQTSTLTLQQPWGSWDGGLWLRRTGARADVDPVTFADAIAPARSTVGVSAGWKVAPGWRLGAKLDNATNARHAAVLGDTPTPRTLSLSLSGQL